MKTLKLIAAALIMVSASCQNNSQKSEITFKEFTSDEILTIKTGQVITIETKEEIVVSYNPTALINKEFKGNPKKSISIKSDVPTQGRVDILTKSGENIRKYIKVID
jgi:ABC-type Fe3+-hydroxamate transport system substrate-binding protein